MKKGHQDISCFPQGFWYSLWQVKVWMRKSTENIEASELFWVTWGKEGWKIELLNLDVRKSLQQTPGVLPSSPSQPAPGTHWLLLLLGVQSQQDWRFSTLLLSLLSYSLSVTIHLNHSIMMSELIFHRVPFLWALNTKVPSNSFFKKSLYLISSRNSRTTLFFFPGWVLI